MNVSRKICAVIATYNADKYIQKCLDSLISTDTEIDIVIVDNHSTDNTLSLISTYPANIIALDKNLGFGAANNKGIQYALSNLNPSHVLLINQDAYLEHSTWIHLGHALDCVGTNVLSLIQLDGTGSCLDENSASFYLSHDRTPKLMEDAFFGRLKVAYRTKFTNAASWMIPVEILKKVGGFNPTFYHYAEDQNFIDRLHYHGFELFLTPLVRVRHDRSTRDSRQLTYRDELNKIHLLLSNPSQRIDLRFTLSILKYVIARDISTNLQHILTFRILLSLFNGNIAQILRLRNETKTPTEYLFISNR